MKRLPSWFFKKNPFVRLFLALTTGIILQWYLQLTLLAWVFLFVAAIFKLLVFFQLPLFKRYAHTGWNGLFVVVLFIALGGMMTWFKDIRNHKDWIGKNRAQGITYLARIDEPLTEKTGSFKAKASVQYCFRNDSAIKQSGEILLYFTKYSLDSTGLFELKQLRFGSLIIFNKPLQEIHNSGNPGGFDYKRYCLFKQITHQVFLKQMDWVFYKQQNDRLVRKNLYLLQDKIVHHLRSTVPGESESGLAEALLIGYKDDLDPALVQSYSNTGVVHIIAISGLHLGLIYAILVLLLKPGEKKGYIKWFRVLIILSVLWGFSLLAGGQPSVLRSALMFSFIVIGESLNRKTSIINSLAGSAFVLLCINPFWLWDLGFQLSYTAVLSIVIFMKPIYNLFFIRNRLLDLAWKLNSVTLAAQILTVPICIYHFHQFPVYFLISNFIAVPLSSLILIGELFLCFTALVPKVASLTGEILSGCISLMNKFIRAVEQLPGSCWEGLQITFSQLLLLYAFIVAVHQCLIDKRKYGVWIASLCILIFLLLRSLSFLDASQQEKIIVYNIPRKTAMDLVAGRKYFFVGDSMLNKDGFERNFHLKPARTRYRITELSNYDYFIIRNNSFSFAGKKFLLISDELHISRHGILPVDIGIVSGKRNIKMDQLLQSYTFKELVLDASVPDWKIEKLRRSCDSLQIPCFIVKEKGAFVRSLR